MDSELRTQTLGTTMGRRQFLIGSAAAVAGLGLASCGWPQGQGSGQTSSKITIALGTFGNEQLDPRTSAGDNQPFLRLMYDPLMGYDRAAQQPSKATGIAKDWSLSSDGQVLTFNLRSGVRFHDGSALTADDVVFTFQRLFLPGTTSTNAGLLKTFLGTKDNVVAPDKQTVQFHFVQNGFPLFQFFPWLDTESMIVPKAYIESKGEDYFRQHPIGSGPFKLTGHSPGSSMTLEANKQYWGGGHASFNPVGLRLIAEETTRSALLRSGEADAGTLGPEEATNLKAAGHNLFKSAVGSVEMLYFPNLYRNTPPIADARVRRALGLAINKSEINKSLFKGLGKTTGSFQPRASFGISGMPAAPYDPEKAKSLLAEAGFAKGFSISFQGFDKAGWDQKSVMEAIAGTWSQIGVKADIVFRDYGAYRADWVAKKLPDPSVTLHPMPGYADWLGLQSGLLKSTGVITIGGTKELDQLVGESFAAPDQQKEKTAFEAVDKYLADNSIVLSIAELGTLGVTSKSITDWTIGDVPLSLNLPYFLWSKPGSAQ